jgi:predicted enzyme related to lactoylglutathione lyase
MTTTIAAPSIDFVIYYVADLDASLHFFEGALGFTHLPEGDGPDFRQFVDGGGNGFGLLRASEGTPAAGEVRIYYKTPDIAALRERWTAQGIVASPIIALPFGKIFEFATPDGYTLTAMEEA